MPNDSLKDKIQSFARTAWRSGFDMEFYRQVRTEPWTGGLRYFLKVMAILAAVMTLALGPAIYVGLRGVRHYVEGKIPDGASISLNRGQLSAALPMPFVLFEETASTVPVAERQRIVLDTAVVGLDRPRESIGENGVLIGRDAVFVRSPSEERTYPLKSAPNLSLNKRQVTVWIDDHVLPVSLGLALVLGLLYFLAIAVGNALFVLFGAGLSRLIGRSLGVGLVFRQWLACGFFAVTWPLVLSAVFGSLGLGRIPVFPVVFFMIMVAVLTDERAKSTKPEGATPSEPPPEGGEEPKGDGPNGIGSEKDR